MDIVPLDKIPKKEEIQDTPLDNLMKVYKVCLDMEILCKKNNGIGLSAVQVGIPWKLFIVRFDISKKTEHFRYYVNCSYDPLVSVNEKHLQSLEGCLSLRNAEGGYRQFLVDRYPKIKVKGQELQVTDNLKLNDIEINLDDPKDIYTVVFQHECDHGSGVLISDIGKEMEIWR